MAAVWVRALACTATCGLVRSRRGGRGGTFRQGLSHSIQGDRVVPYPSAPRSSRSVHSVISRLVPRPGAIFCVWVHLFRCFFRAAGFSRRRGGVAAPGYGEDKVESTATDARSTPVPAIRGQIPLPRPRHILPLGLPLTLLCFISKAAFCPLFSWKSMEFIPRKTQATKGAK